MPTNRWTDGQADTETETLSLYLLNIYEKAYDTFGT